MIKEIIILLLLPVTMLLLHHPHFGTCDEGSKIRFKISPPTPSFYGRVEFLEQLHESIERSKSELLEPSESSSQSSTLFAGQQSSIIKIVTGEGGLGKTELVRKYVESYGTANYDHLIWLNGENIFENGGKKELLLTPPFLALSTHELVQVSTIEEKNGVSSSTSSTIEDGGGGKDEEEFGTVQTNYDDDDGGDLKPIKEIVQEIYLKISQRDTLVIFDDIEVNSGTDENPLKIFLPLQLPRPLKQPVILIVSKTGGKIWEDKNWGGSSSDEPEIFKLEGFTPEENVGFILQELKSVKFPNQDLATIQEDARQLGELLHGIPLALQLAIAYIKEDLNSGSGSGMENYVQIYQTAMLEKRSEKHGPWRQSPVATAWLVIRKKLEENFEGSFAVEIMEALAFLSDEGTLRKFLFAVSSSSSSSPPSIEEEDHEQNFFKNCIKILQKYGLIIVEKEEDQIIRCQKEIQTVVMLTIRMDHLDQLKMLLERAEKFLARQLSMENASTIQSHLRCMKILATKVVTRLSKSGLSSDHGQLRLLAFEPKIAFMYEEIGDGKKAKILLEIFFQQLNQIMDIHFDSSLSEQEWLAETIFGKFFELHLNNSKALPTTTEAKDGGKKMEEFLNKIYTLSEKILGESHPASIWIFQKMAETLGNLTKFEKSLIIYRKIYEIQTDLLLNLGSEKGESPQSIATLHKIGDTLTQSGQLDEAVGVYFDLYEIEKSAISSRRRHKSDPEKLTRPVHKLALILADGKEYQKSLFLFRLLIQLQELLLGRQNPAILSTLCDMAGVHLLEENFPLAIRIFDQSHLSLNQSLGPTHPDTIKAKRDLAKAFQAAGQIQKSRQLFQEIYTLKQKSLGSDHPETVVSLLDLAQVVLKQGDVRKAKELYTKLYQFRIKNLGEENLDTMATLERIGLVNLGQMKYEDALQNFDKVLQIRDKILDHPTHLSMRPSTVLKSCAQFLAGNHATQKKVKDINVDDGDGGTEKYLEASEILKKEFELAKSDDAAMETMIQTLQDIFDSMKNDQQKDGGQTLQLFDFVHGIQTEILGMDSTAAILTVRQMTDLLIHKSRFLEASKMAAKLVNLSKQKYGTNHPDTLKALEVEAQVLEKEGKFEQAESTYREMYSMSREIFGDLHWKSIGFLKKIGEILQNLKEFDESAAILDEVYQLKLKSVQSANDYGGRSLGPSTIPFLGSGQAEDDIDVLSAQSDLALAYTFQRKYEDALKLYLKVYEKRSQTLGSTHLDTMASYERVADMLMELGGMDEAEKAFKKIYALKKKLLGPVHNETNSILFKMVTIHESANDTREALRVLKLACERQTKLDVSSAASPSFDDLSCDTRMADLYRLRGNYSEALKLGWKILKQQRQTLGETHDETLKTKLMMAELYHASHKLDFAEDLYEDVYKKRVKILGPQHPDSLTVLEKIAIMTNNDLKNYPEALELYTTIFEFSKKKLGEENVDTIKYLDIIAQVQHNLRDFEGSLETSRKVYKLRSKVLGEEHEDSLNTLKNIAVVLCEQGECKGEKGGLKILEKILKIKRRTLGRHHPDTQQLAAAVKDIKDRMAAEAEEEEKRKTPQFKIQKVDL